MITGIVLAIAMTWLSFSAPTDRNVLMKLSTHHVKHFANISFSVLSLLSFNTLANHQIDDGINKSGAPALIIDDIVCRGNDTTQCSFISKKYYQQPGDVLSPAEIADAKLRLGTLIQFRDVNIHLEKGHKRDHVIVVFDIVEASNIQYEASFGAFYTKSDSQQGQCQDVVAANQQNVCSKQNDQSIDTGINLAMTHFNFLGLGKRLSIAYNGNQNNRDTSNNTNAPGQDMWQQVDIDSDQRRHNLAITYYDPHLFNSSHYFLTAKVGSTTSKTESEASSINDDLLIDNNRLNDFSSQFADIEFGRRFASHSFIAIGAQSAFNQDDSTTIDGQPVHINNDDDNPISLTARYGWNSENDSLFPTQGSKFTTSYRHTDLNNDNSIDVSYLRHFDLTGQQNYIVTLGGNLSHAQSSYYFDQQRFTNSSNSSGLSARFTSINAIDTLEGTYNGWYLDARLSKINGVRTSNINSSFTLQAGYTYQSDAMIYRFTLGYNTGEKL